MNIIDSQQYISQNNYGVHMQQQFHPTQQQYNQQHMNQGQQQINQQIQLGIETLFISGLDDKINEADIKSFFQNMIQGEINIKIHYYTILEKQRIFAEIELDVNDYQTLLNQQITSFKIKNCFIKLITKNQMKTIIISKLPSVISEKDLFLILHTITPGLKRIIIADDADLEGRTKNMALAVYNSYEQAAQAIIKLKNNVIMQNTVDSIWSLPTDDVIGELSKETRALYVKNININTTINTLRKTFGHFGKVQRIKRLSNKAFVVYDNVQSAKKAMEQMNERRVNGSVWRIFPAKKFDEERAKELPDRNLSFSKNFLEEYDQQMLLKFIYDGQQPDIVSLAQQRAREIVDKSMSIQLQQVEMLRIQKQQFLGIQQQPNPQLSLGNANNFQTQNQNSNFNNTQQTFRNNNMGMSQMTNMTTQSFNNPNFGSGFGGMGNKM